MYKVYVKLTPDCYISQINSELFINPDEDWTMIDQGEGDRYVHAQGNYLDKPLMTEDNCYQYRLDGDVVRPCTSEEIETQREPAQPTLEERLRTMEQQLQMMKEQ